MNEILGTVSLILGIIVSCITIYQFLSKKSPKSATSDSPQARQTPAVQQRVPSQPYSQYPQQKAPANKNYLGCIIAFTLTLLITFAAMYFLLALNGMHGGLIAFFGLPLLAASIAGLLVLNLKKGSRA